MNKKEIEAEKRILLLRRKGKLNEKEIEAEKDKQKAIFYKKWEQKKRDIDNQIVELKKQEEQFLIDNKEGYNCKKCGKFVEKSKRPPSNETHGMCWRCHDKMQREKKKKDFLNKIKGAKLVDVEFTCYTSLKSLTIYKDGMMFRFKGATDDEVSYIELDDEWSEPLDEVIDRPGDRPRLEKPLVIYE